MLGFWGYLGGLPKVKAWEPASVKSQSQLSLQTVLSVALRRMGQISKKTTSGQSDTRCGLCYNLVSALQCLSHLKWFFSGYFRKSFWMKGAIAPRNKISALLLIQMKIIVLSRCVVIVACIITWSFGFPISFVWISLISVNTLIWRSRQL